MQFVFFTLALLGACSTEKIGLEAKLMKINLKKGESGSRKS